MAYLNLDQSRMALRRTIVQKIHRIEARIPVATHLVFYLQDATF